MDRQIELVINGTTYAQGINPRVLLSDFIRHDIGLTGTHVGCEHGICGACTVELDGVPIRSCLMLAVQANGCHLRTVEGLTDGLAGEGLHPLQQAFHETYGLQCGFCTPGFLMSLDPLLLEEHEPSEEEVRHMLAGNLCRCTGYQSIVDAVRLAHRRIHGAGESARRGDFQEQ